MLVGSKILSDHIGSLGFVFVVLVSIGVQLLYVEISSYLISWSFDGSVARCNSRAFNGEKIEIKLFNYRVIFVLCTSFWDVSISRLGAIGRYEGTHESTRDSSGMSGNLILLLWEVASRDTRHSVLSVRVQPNDSAMTAQ